MATQSIEVKDFTGGRNFVTSPFNLYPTEAEEFRNISLNSTGMRTSNFVPTKKLILAKGTGPYSVAPEAGEIYELVKDESCLLEKIRFFQGSKFIIKSGVPYKLMGGGKLASTVVTTTIKGEAKQTAHTKPADGTKIKVVNYTYFMSYRTKAGFESPLEEIGKVTGHKEWDANFVTETASDQIIHVDALPAEHDYLRFYRMGDNISYPSLICQLDHAGVVNLSLGNAATFDGTKKELTFAILDDKLGIRATTWGASYPGNLHYLTATKYGLAAAKGSKVYLSMNRPDAWSSLSMLDLGSNITGMASVYRGMVIFTESSAMYLITGSTVSSLQVNLITTGVGCSSNATIVEIGQRALVWLYHRRFYIFNGTTVSELEPNTYDYTYFVEKQFDQDVTAVSGYNKYIIGDQEGLVLIDMNHRYNPFINYDLARSFLWKDTPSKLRELLGGGRKNLGAYHTDGSFYSFEEKIYNEIGYIDEFPETDDFIIGCYTQPGPDDTWVCETDNSRACAAPYIGVYGKDAPVLPVLCPIGAKVGRFNIYDIDIIPVWMESEYKSPMFTFGDMTGQCAFSSVEVLYEGELDAFVYVDDAQIKIKQDFASKRRSVARILLPNDQARGNYLQLKLRFNGAVYGYRVNGEPLMQFSK